jgi:hypothetical protein
MRIKDMVYPPKKEPGESPDTKIVKVKREVKGVQRIKDITADKSLKFRSIDRCEFELARRSPSFDFHAEKSAQSILIPQTVLFVSAKR